MDLMSAPMALLDFGLTKVVPFVFVLTIVVFFHELGHFSVARWNKVKVDAFAVGFGPELFGFNDKHGTRWKFCVIPLGGYVKFLGDQDAASRPDHAALQKMSSQEQEGAFENKALWRRAAVVAAGPIANFILASVIYTGIFMYYGETKLAPVVGSIQENSAAEEAGFQLGDRVVSIQGGEITSFQDIARYTLVSSDEPLDFIVDRDGSEISITAIPRMTKRTDRFGNEFQTGLVGIGPGSDPANIIQTPLGPVAAFVKSIDSIGLIISRTYHFVRELIGGKQDASQLRGPLGIGQMTSQVATLGILQLITLAAALSVSIGLMNLLPVPMLDGGHLLFYALEAIRGKALDPKAQDVAFRIGLTCVLMLMFFATSNDILRLLGGSG
ncbi:MAG: RIP metalloprotease RseP [Hyphomicrobiales bacterium]|nr:RIP metalloprotease RseP [Hyphomicrobiales bacterium]